MSARPRPRHCRSHFWRPGWPGALRACALALVLACLLGNLASAQAQAPSGCLDPEVLQVALIPKNALNTQAQAQQPLLQALQQSTGKRVQLLSMASYGAVIEGMVAGQVQVAELGPASYVLLSKRARQFEPFAALSRTPDQGQGRYHSLLVVRADSGIDSIQALRGRALALTDPSSTSGAILPELAMPQLTGGQQLTDFFARVVFMGSHDKALAAVRSGRTQAAFVSSTSSSWQEDDPQWRVLWRSPAIMGNPFVLDTRLCPVLREGIRQAFLTQQPRLQSWLEQRQVRQVMAVSAQDYAGIRALLEAR